MAGERFKLTRIADALATMCPILLLRLLKKAALFELGDGVSEISDRKA